MTLNENKKVCLGLIEEYSPSNMYLTDDEDIRNRLNLVYSTNYQEMSQKKKILKTKIYTITEDSNGMTEYMLPSNMYQFKRLIGLDDNNERKSIAYDIIGKKIYIKNEEGKYILEYYAYPEVITEETEEDFELEIDQDVQLILPYAVANDILKVDPSADYTAFYNEYRRKIEELDSRIILPSIEVEETDTIGGI